MDHEVVVREKMTERYLLNELEPEARDEFEEHFFDCPQCALDVQAGSTFVEQARRVLAEQPQTEARAYPASGASKSSAWLAWLRPVSYAAAMALLLAVAGYQNLVTYPALRQKLNHPQLLPWASVNIGTWGSSGPVVSARPGEGFLLFVRIPPEGNYATYTADLYNSSGKREWSLTIPASSAQDQWPIRVPGETRSGGSYILVVRGVTAAGESKEIGRAPFELHLN
ncbi:MAG TPA: zf-HC2 domain-containing protein [Terriglobales bacterium]|nr:zf-HC2 domain-containing protein [Terriglobales bacterium]